MKKSFFTQAYMEALARSYTVPCILWTDDDEKFYHKNLLPTFKRFLKDLLPKVKKVDSRVEDRINSILVTCDNREQFVVPESEYCEIGVVIGHRKPIKGQHFAGLLFGFTPTKIVLAGGFFGLTGDSVALLNDFLEKKDTRYQILQENEDFADCFGSRGFCQIPDEYSLDTSALKTYKNFVGCTGEIPARFITDAILPDIIIAHYKAVKAMNRILTRALRPVEQKTATTYK